MISSELVFVQLAQQSSYVCIVELAMMLEASVSEVRQSLKGLGDRVECNDKDEWRILKNIVPERILSPAEKVERDSLELTVQQAFYIAGQALRSLRDKKLYRETHSSFESYVRDRFDFTKRAAYYLIDAYEVVNNLKAAHSLAPSDERCEAPASRRDFASKGSCGSLLKSEQFVHSNKGTILPTKESQCRPLAKLSPERQREVWQIAVEKAKGKVPSARIIKTIINQSNSDADMKAKPKDSEMIYKSGTGIDYIVHLDEETYKLLESYQGRIGKATKNGAIRSLLDNAIAE